MARFNQLGSLNSRWEEKMDKIADVNYVKHHEANDKLNHVRDLLKDLIKIGADYEAFQSPKITHKNLKKALKMLEGLN
jgi:predicted transcriptional regulator